MDVTIRNACEAFFLHVSRQYGISLERVREGAFQQKKEPVKEVKGLSEVKVPITKKQQQVFASVEAARELIGLTPSMGQSLVSLREMCKERGLPYSGTKAALIDRLNNPGKVVRKTGGVKESVKGGVKGPRKKKTQFKPRDVSAIIQKLQGATSKLGIRKNDAGHYVHPDTQLVFDPHTMRVIGRMDTNNVKYLNSADVELCISMGLKYNLPENLDFGVVKIVDKVLEEQLNEDDYKNGDDLQSDEEYDSDDEEY